MTEKKFNIDAIRAIQKANQKKYKNEASILTGLDDIPPIEVDGLNDPIVDKLLSGSSDKGGFIRGGIIELSGGYSSGKTTLALEYLANMARLHPNSGVAFIDVEASLDKDYARHLGVPIDSERFIYSRPKDGQEALTTTNNLIKTNMFSAVVLDSWASLVPPRQADADDIGNAGVGDLARLSSDALRIIKNSAAQTQTTFLILNQERVNMTPMGARGIKTTGGNAIEFYTDMRLRLFKPAKDKDDRILQITKSKSQAIPFTEASICISHGIGLDRIQSVLNYAIDYGVIGTGGGGWLTWQNSLNEEVKIQGREKFATMFLENESIRNDLCKQLGIESFMPRTPFIRKTIGGTLEDNELTE